MSANMRPWMCAAALSLATIPSSATADDDVSLESQAGFGSATGNQLVPPGTFIAAPTVSLVWRHGRIAAELNSALVSGGPGNLPAYWSLGPGVRYYVPLLSGVRNNIEVALSVFGRVGASYVSQTEHGLNETATGYSVDTGGGIELSLAPVTSMLISKLQITASSRILHIARGSRDKTASGLVTTASLGWAFGVRF